MTQAVLLTAAVRPDPRFTVALADPDARLRQYVASVREWLRFGEQTGARVVVVETSRSAELLNQVPALRQLEVIEFEPSDQMADRGKGAVEAGAIDHALAGLANEGVRTITKVTGRLGIVDASRTLPPLAANSVMVRRTLDRRFVDARLIHATVDVWTDSLRGMAGAVNEVAGTYIEHVVGLRLVQAEFERGTDVLRFPKRPRFRGQSGTTGSQYNRLDSAIRIAVMERAERLVVRMAAKQI
jgi:hypothetical protein